MTHQTKVAPAKPGSVNFEMRGDIAVLTIDNPPVNAGSHAVRLGIVEGIENAGKAGASGAVLLGAGHSFVAGSDLREFGQPLAKPELPDVIACIEEAPFPVVAALHGVALGGGLELALGCDWRIAAPGTMVGLPEVSLGFVPGAGGTLRLPRLIGRKKAMDLICRASRIPAQDAVELGLIDALASADLLASAVEFLGQVSGKRRAKDIETPPDPSAELESVSAKLLKRGKGRPNVAEAIRLVEQSTRPAKDALKDERAAFQQLRLSDDAFALRYLFFAERKAAQVDALDLGLAQDVRSIGIVGGGTMGQGIARAFLAAGLPVVIAERDADAMNVALTKTREGIDKQVATGRLGKAESEARKSNLSGTDDYAAFADCDLVVEAVFEDMAVKREVLTRLEAVLAPKAILATNTSYLDIDEMAQGLEHPCRVLGLHFFSPADVMKLLEVVRAKDTSDQTLATGLKLARKLGKQPVVARVGEGFIGNRIYAAYRRRAELLVLDGAAPQDVDAAITAFGFAMGPFAVSDMSGLDIAWAMRKRQAATRDPQARYVSIPDRLCEMGRLGRKTGAGWYDYSTGKATPDPEVAEIIDTVRREDWIIAKSFTAEDIQNQLLAAMINEAACLIEDGIAQRASDIDVALTNGYGFPRWKGGPLYWASQQDRGALSAELHVLAQAVGNGFRQGDVDMVLGQLNELTQEK